MLTATKAPPQPVGSQLSVFLHYIWPIIQSFLAGLFKPAPTPVPTPATATESKASGGAWSFFGTEYTAATTQLSWLLNMLQQWLSTMLGTVDWKREELTLELEAIDFVSATILPTLMLPAPISAILSLGLSTFRKTVADALAALPVT